MSFNYKCRDNYNDDILCKIRRKKHIVKYNNHISLHKEIFLKPYLKNSLSLVQNWKNTQIWWASELLQKIKGFKTKAKKIPRRRTKVSHFQETLWIIFRQRDACAGRGKMETLQTTSDNIKRLQTTWSSSLVILRTIYSSWLSYSWDPLEMKTLCIVKLLYHLRIESNVLGIIFPLSVYAGVCGGDQSQQYVGRS